MRWLVYSLLLLLSGCGFHLKGSYQLPEQFQSVSFSSFDHYAHISRLVRQALLDNGIKLDSHGPQVKLLNDKLDRQTLSLFSTGQVAEYELIYTLNWQLTLPDQAPQQRSIEIRRDYQDDPTRTLAKDRERQLLLDEMRKDAAEQLVRQLAKG